jgi:hypothetical protein
MVPILLLMSLMALSAPVHSNSVSNGQATGLRLTLGTA